MNQCIFDINYFFHSALPILTIFWPLSLHLIKTTSLVYLRTKTVVLCEQLLPKIIALSLIQPFLARHNNFSIFIVHQGMKQRRAEWRVESEDALGLWPQYVYIRAVTSAGLLKASVKNNHLVTNTAPRL